MLYTFNYIPHFHTRYTLDIYADSSIVYKINISLGKQLVELKIMLDYDSNWYSLLYLCNVHVLQDRDASRIKNARSFED